MNAIVQKWGNSHAVRIPKAILADLGIYENDQLEITTENESIVLKKKEKKVHRTVQERLEAFYGKNIDDIHDELTVEEISTGTPLGEEVW